MGIERATAFVVSFEIKNVWSAARARNSLHSNPKEFAFHLAGVLDRQMWTYFGRIERHLPAWKIDFAPLCEPFIVEHLCNGWPLGEAEVLRCQRNQENGFRLRQSCEPFMLHYALGVRADHAHGFDFFVELGFRHPADRNRDGANEASRQVARKSLVHHHRKLRDDLVSF